MRERLVPSRIATSACSVILALTCLCLAGHEKKTNLKIWTAGLLIHRFSRDPLAQICSIARPCTAVHRRQENNGEQQHETTRKEGI